MSKYLGFEPTKDPNYYFLSYNSEDVSRIIPIVKKLAADGIPLWNDYGLEYGKEWELQINTRIKASQAVILFFTKGILKKEKSESYVYTEYQIATHYRKKIYVIIVDAFKDEDIPDHFVPWYLQVKEHHNISIINDMTLAGKVRHIEDALKNNPNATKKPSFHLQKTNSNKPDVDNETLRPHKFSILHKQKTNLAPKNIDKPIQSSPVKRYSEGLDYREVSNGNYSVLGMGSCRTQDIRISPTTPMGGRVISIDAEAFSGYRGLTTVTIPSSVTNIGRNAFSNCVNLTTVNISYGVTSIGNSAFSHCIALTTVTIPDSLVFIRNWAFNNCSKLADITIPDSVTTIGKFAFSNCTELSSIYIPDSVTHISENTFRYCNSLVIYCAHPKRPLTWDKNWNPEDRPVFWNYKPE